MTLHQERQHPEYVEGCFACKISTQLFNTPPDFHAVPKGDKRTNSHDDISSYSAFKQELQQTLRNDKEGRYERAR